MRVLLSLIFLWCLSHGLTAPVQAQSQPSPDTGQDYAHIFGYFMVGRDDRPDASVTEEQFRAHLALLKQGGYTVLPLDQIITALKNNEKLPVRSVAITFDGGDRSILTKAAPLLAAHDMPYSIFIAPKNMTQDGSSQLGWKDIETLLRTGRVTIGYHPDSYQSFHFETEEIIRKNLNNASDRIYKNLHVKPQIFSFPYGEYSEKFSRILSGYNLLGSVGQNSAPVTSFLSDTPLPRFMLTEEYADPDRVQFILETKPLYIKDIYPPSSILNESEPLLGFTLLDQNGVTPRDVRCSASDEQPLTQTHLGANRIELRLTRPVTQERLRITCTASVADADGKTMTRWAGVLLVHPDKPPSEEQTD